MADKAWKQAERRLAKFFGTERTPMSGGNSKHTRSDTLHKRFFFEAKQRVVHTTWTLWRQTKELATKEGKMPVIALFEKNKPGFLLAIHSDDLHEFCRLVLEASEESSGASE